MNDSSDSRRRTLLDEIAGEVIETAELTGIRRLRASTRRALETVDRAAFVDETDALCAYINRPLAIGHGQTISQPFIVALMTDLLEIDENSRVLEIGTGSGYQAAILGEIAREVYSIEIVEPLAERAERVLARLGYDNVHVRCGNGRLGWPEQAPFDGIIVTAAADGVPPALVRQLAPGGMLVIPVARAAFSQNLLAIRKHEDGSIDEKVVLPVMFVPLTGRENGSI